MRIRLGVAAVAAALALAGCDGPSGGEREEDAPTVTIPSPGGGGGAGGGGAEGGEVDAGACEGADLAPSDDNRRAVERATLCLVNAERRERDRGALREVAALRQAARAKARDMVEKDYFAHTGPGGRGVRDWVRDTDYVDGVREFRLGENLGWGSRGADTPADVVRGWMGSPAHRENILRESFEDTGIGVVAGTPRAGRDGATYVQMFGAR